MLYCDLFVFIWNSNKMIMILLFDSVTKTSSLVFGLILQIVPSHISQQRAMWENVSPHPGDWGTSCGRTCVVQAFWAAPLSHMQNILLCVFNSANRVTMLSYQRCPVVDLLQQNETLHMGNLEIFTYLSFNSFARVLCRSSLVLKIKRSCSIWKLRLLLYCIWTVKT